MGTVESVLAWIAAHETPLTIAGLAALMLLGLLSLWVAKRRMGGLKLYGQLLAAGTIGFSAEGMWEVATQDLDLSTTLAIAVFAVGDGTLIYLAKKAEKAKAAHEPWRKYARGVWRIAAVMGGIVAMSYDSPVEIPLRMALPLLAAYVWWLDVADGQADDDEPAGRWRFRWTPRRALIEAGVILPDGKDVEKVDHAYRVAALSRVMTRLDELDDRTPGKLLRGWVDWRTARGLRKLQRLTVDATDAMVAEAAANAQRARVVRARTRSLAAEELDRIAAAEAKAAAAEAKAAEAVAEADRQRAAAAAATAALTAATAGSESATAEVEQWRAAARSATAEADRQRAAAAAATADARRQVQQALSDHARRRREEVDALQLEIRGLRDQIRELEADAQPVSGVPGQRGRRTAAESCRDVLAYFTRFPNADERDAMVALGLKERSLREYRNRPERYLPADEIRAIYNNTTPETAGASH